MLVLLMPGTPPALRGTILHHQNPLTAAVLWGGGSR